MINQEDRHWWYRGRRRIVCEELAKLPTGPELRVLDAGCGSGRLLDELRDYGHVTGLDLNPDSVEIARSRGHEDVVQGPVEQLPWPVEAASFDAVVSFEVIEHLLRPRTLFEGARTALRPGGGLAVSTPYHGLAKAVAIAALRFDEHFAVEGDHIRFFSDRALGRLAGETGFEVERIHHLGRRWPLWANSLLWAHRT